MKIYSDLNLALKHQNPRISKMLPLAARYRIYNDSTEGRHSDTHFDKNRRLHAKSQHNAKGNL